MDEQGTRQVRKSAAQAFTPISNCDVLQRKGTWTERTVVGDRCTTGLDRSLVLQRYEASHVKSAIVPTIVNEVLRSPGQPLDPTPCTFLESRFGHDFSRVRVHTDTKAAESARAVNARSYTVGQDVVFGKSQYSPWTTTGRGLLAHELAHVVQQNGQNNVQSKLEIGPNNSRYEQEADGATDQVLRGGGTEKLSQTTVHLQRTIGDGHDLSAARFSGNVILEAVYDGERAIRKGHIGAAVRLIQESLLVQGYSLPRFGADGDFGDETEAAVRQFQIDAGASGRDGIVGPETMQLLDSRDPGGSVAPGRRPGTSSVAGPAGPQGLPGPMSLPPQPPMTMAPWAPSERGQVAVSIALQEVGVREDPSGSNRGPCPPNATRGCVDAYTGGRAHAWCAHFVSWAFEQTGFSPFGHIASVSRLRSWARGRGYYVPRARVEEGHFTPMAGDVFTKLRYEGSGPQRRLVGGHTGFVVEYNRAARTVSTVEGNTGDRVRRRTRSIRQLDGFIRIGE